MQPGAFGGVRGRAGADPAAPVLHHALRGRKGKRGPGLFRRTGTISMRHWKQQDMRALSKTLNKELNGRGGGSALMAQRTFQAAKQAILETFTGLVKVIYGIK